MTKFGVQKVMMFCMTITICGILLLGYSPLYQLATLGALLIGIGSVVGMLGTSNIINQRFYSKAYSFMIGLTLALGLVIASYSGEVIELCLQKFNWQSFYLVVAIVVIVQMIIVSIFIDKKSYSPIRATPELLRLLMRTVKTPRLILMALFGGAMTAPMHGFADVWGIDYLVLHFNLSKTDAVIANSLVFFGMAIGAPTIGYIAQKYQIYRKLITICGVIMTVSFAFLVVANNASFIVICGLLLIIGIGSSYSPLVFTIIIHSVDKKLGDIAVGLTNMSFMIFGFVYHPLIGFIIDKISLTDDLKTAYLYGILVIPLGLLAGTIGLGVVTNKTQ